MANHKSAEKRHRQSLKRRERNISQRSAVKTAVKKAIGAVAGTDTSARVSALKEATSLIDKAATHGVLHKNAARRKISRLHKRANVAASARAA